MGTLVNSEYSDECISSGIYCLLRQNGLQSKKYNFFYKILTCGPSIYIMDHPKFIVSNQKEEPIRA